MPKPLAFSVSTGDEVDHSELLGTGVINANGIYQYKSELNSCKATSSHLS